MYLEFGMFVAFLFFAVLDVKYRQIKLGWFVGLALFVLAYKILFDPDYLTHDILWFGVSAICMMIAFFSRLFAKADLLGLLILSFAVPVVGFIPTGIPLLLLTLLFSNWAIAISNVSYNMSDCILQRTPLFENTHTIQNARHRTLKSLYWSFLARRKRNSDRFVLSAEKRIDHDNNAGIILSMNRSNRMYDDTRFVFSAHPQFVYSTIAYAVIWIFGNAFQI